MDAAGVTHQRKILLSYLLLNSTKPATYLLHRAGDPLFI
jgi:hypothetical protein